MSLTLSRPITCVADMRALARRRLPRMVFDYVDGGAWTEATATANVQALQRICLRQRIGRDVSRRDTSASLFGHQSRMPAAIAPTGMAGLVHPEGELALARAAAAFGVPFTLSIASSHSLEAVRQVSDGTLWLQVSLVRDQTFLRDLLDRAADQGCAALVLTMDFHVGGQRNRDLRNGLGLPLRPTPLALLDLLARWRWAWRMRRPPPRFGNIIGHAAGVTDLASFQVWQAGQFELALGWHHVDWIRRHWAGPLIVKGVMDPDDACQAFEAGADAISVSNHGGRQLDGAPASVEVLPAIVAAAARVGKPVLLDGGIRSGQDVLRALGLGASAVLLGRAPLYGLAASGQAGVGMVLDILQREMDLTLAMCGCPDASRFSADHLWQPPGFPLEATE